MIFTPNANRLDGLAKNGKTKEDQCFETSQTRSTLLSTQTTAMQSTKEKKERKLYVVGPFG